MSGFIFHYKGFDREKNEFVTDVQRGNPVCDFCNETHIVGYFQKKPNCEISRHESADGITTRVMDSDGIWAACFRCKQLIHDNKMWELATRAARRFFHSKDNRMDYDACLATVLVSHGSFWNDR